MRLFRTENGGLQRLKEKNVALEKHIQQVTEKNLDQTLGLQFVASEFRIKNSRFDTLAFDIEAKAFVIVEYKRDKNSSVIDQGLTYLSLLLNNKAEFVLAYNEKMKQSQTKEFFDWSQTRVIFIAEAFTQFQIGSLGFKNLPIELWKVNLFEEGFLCYEKVETPSGEADFSSITKSSDTKVISQELKELVVYDEEHHFSEGRKDSKELYELLKTELMNIVNGTQVRFLKHYIAFDYPNTGRSFVEVIPQKRGLKVCFRPEIKAFRSTVLDLIDRSNVGHWGTGNTAAILTKKEELPHIMSLVQQAIELSK